MLKLAKYLKPYILAIIVVLGLLYVQAMTDLSLPDYMSNIVDIGIGKGGIESAVPQKLTEKDYNSLKALLENQSMAERMYEEKDGVYSLKEKPDSDEEAAFEKAIVKAVIIQQMSSQATGQIPLEQMESLFNSEYEKLGDTVKDQLVAEYIKVTNENAGINNAQQMYIIKTGALMLAIALLGTFCSIGVAWLSAKIGSGLSAKMRFDVFSKVEGFSNTEFDKFGSSSLITRTTNDITQMQMFVIMSLRMIIYAPIMGIGGVVKILGKNPSMTWIIALAVCVLLITISIIISVANPRFKLIQKLIDKLNLVTRESLTGMLVVRAFNTEEYEEQKFENVNKKLADTNLFVNRVMALMMPVMMFIMNGVSLLIIWVGAKQIDQNAMQVGDMMAYMQYSMQIIMSFLMVSMSIIMFPRAAVSGERISAVLATTPSITDKENAKALPEKIGGTVEFKNVSFAYPGADEPVLENISFTAKPGETTAFIGSTGSGKSTLINLIPRFYDVTQGEILVDGVNIKDITQHSLRENIGYVPQKGILFSGTIESNIKYADENGSDEVMKKSAEISKSAEFIAKKEDGYNSAISQGGTNVSGGQKQRLSIARALFKQAPIMIFDDSFSALDYKTDKELRTALKQETGDSTVLIVAQRISTIMDAEQIVVLDEGKIAGIGTHKELINSCEVYKEIALSQLSKEELGI